MKRTFYCVAVAMFLAAVGARAQSGVYTKQFRVSPPAPTAPNPFSQATTHQSQPPFGRPTPQRFSASPFPEANRNLGIFIRNRIISSPEHPSHKGTPPTSVYVPWLSFSYAYPLDPYSYGLWGVDPATNQARSRPWKSSSFRIQTSTDPKGKAQSNTSSVTFKSTPAGAQLYIDGNLTGDTPSTVPLASGLHTVSIQERGYRDWQRTLTVSAGGKIVIDATLQGD